MKKLNDNHILSEMANVKQIDSGLPFVVYISNKYNNPHTTPRLKVQQDFSHKTHPDNFVSVVIADNPEVVGGEWELPAKYFRILSRWIEKNRKALILYWEDEVGVGYVMENLLSP